MLGNRVAAGWDLGEEDLLLDVRGEEEQIEELGDPGPAEAETTGQSGLVLDLAAILSRVRSAIISRSNSAKLISMLSVSRPMASAVEKFWVTLTKAAPARLKRSIIWAKSRSDRDSRSTL